MKPGRIVALVVGILLALPALGMFFGGAALTVGYVTEREDDGYFDATLERLSTATAAISTGDVDLRSDPGPPDWLLDFVDVSVRLQVSGDPGTSLFVGIGPLADVESYLSDVAHDEIIDVDGDGDVKYRRIPGTAIATSPTDEAFWVASVSGPGAQVLTWDLAEGEWASVLMNADGSPGVVAEVTTGVRAGGMLAIALSALAVGALVLAVAVTLIVVATRRRAADVPSAPLREAEAAQPVSREPVRLQATLDSPLSHWLWLVKWLLAIPHIIVLVFLWIAFLVLTVIAGVSILFTGRYPRGIFAFNVGVMRWTWRVIYYAGSGGLGTDRYPPFTTGPVADYPATLDVVYPERLSRGLVLVKWWLLAIPHYLILAIIAGGGIGWWWRDTWRDGGAVGGGGLVALLTLVAAVTLLFTGKYPRPLFDLIVGLNRWAFRVISYASLMTDRYPPFRLDQGGSEDADTGESTD